MLCLVDFSKLPHSKLPVKDNVRSDCYGYVTIVSRSVQRGYFISSRTFSGYGQDTGVSRHSTRSLVRAVVGLEKRTVEMEAHAFLFGSNYCLFFIAFIGFLKAKYGRQYGARRTK